MRLYLAAVVGTIGLAACDPHAADSPGVATPPADAPAAAAAPQAETDFTGDFRLVGTEPFWALKIGGDSMVLSRPGQGDLAVTHDGPATGDGRAQWNGRGVSASVTRQACSDGMSDRTYVYAAEVKMGQTVLKGCGDAEPRPGS